MCHQLSFVLTEKAEQVELVRRQMDELPVPPDGTTLPVDLERSDAKDLLARRRRAPKHRAQTRQELCERERLDDVVVCAGVECVDLLRSSPTAETTTIGTSLQARSSVHTSVPLPSGRIRSRTTASNWLPFAALSAVFTVSAVSTA